jgi:hypothetical protein
MKRTSKYDDKHKEAVKSRSITPDTYRGGEFKITKVKSSEFEELEQELFYVDQYQYKDSQKSNVSHFGINVYREDLKKELIEHNKSFKKVLKDSEVISLLNKTEKSKKPEELEQEKYQQLQKYKEESTQNLTGIEKYIVNEAIKHLNEQYKTTVLVEVFERDASGQVKEPLSTHTVVLYKQNNKYLVIDPSNAEFSTILIGTHKDVVACFNKKLKIYQPTEGAEEKGLLGSKAHQWRDCVDIAVKLAFNLAKNNQEIELEKFKDLEVIKTDSLKSNFSIEEVSNSSEIYKILPGELDLYPIRAKQSSNILEQKYINAGLKVFHYISKQLKTKITDLNLHYAQEGIDQIKKGYFEHQYSANEYYQSHKDLILLSEHLKGLDELKLLGLETEIIEKTFYE